MLVKEMKNISRKPLPKRTDKEINDLVLELINEMTLKEKNRSIISNRF